MGKLSKSDIDIDNPLIVILGPTASGKTEFSLSLYEQINCEIISADSRQIYKYLDIGTAKPDKKILRAYPHHLVDFLDPDEQFSAGQFVQKAEAIIEQLYAKNKIPLIVGGTGLYIDALCSGFMKIDFERNDEIRLDLEKQLEIFGKDHLFEKLLNVDPVSAAKYNDKNPRRVIRALEFYYSTGIKFSEAHQKFTQPSKYKVLYLGIDFARSQLYERIDQRCQLMWQNGIVEETKKVLEMGYSPNLNSLNTIGYKEVIKFLNGELTQPQALDEMKKNTRRFAKRQLTWFRRNKKINWIMSNLLDKLVIYDFLDIFR